MFLIIHQIAERAMQQEYQTALALGYSWGEAVDMGWRVRYEVIEMARAGILERK